MTADHDEIARLRAQLASVQSSADETAAALWKAQAECERLREKVEAIDAIEALVARTPAGEGYVAVGANHDDDAKISGWCCELTDDDGYVVVVSHLPSPAAAILSALSAAKAKEAK